MDPNTPFPCIPDLFTPRIERASQAHGPELAQFVCCLPGETFSGFDYVREVQDIIQGEAPPGDNLMDLMRSGEMDFTVLLFRDDDGSLVAVGAHEASRSGPGTHLVIDAVRYDLRGAELEDQPRSRSRQWRRLSTFTLDALIADASVRQRGGFFTAAVHRDNRRSLGVCTRFGFTITNEPEVEQEITSYYDLALRDPLPPPSPIQLPP